MEPIQRILPKLPGSILKVKRIPCEMESFTENIWWFLYLKTVGLSKSSEKFSKFKKAIKGKIDDETLDDLEELIFLI